MAHTPPETIYDLFLNLPPGLSAQAAQGHRVGDVNFFEAVGHGGHSSGSGAYFSYDITDVARSLLAKGRIDRNAVITVIPAGPPGPDARPEIGRLSIIEQ
jgi:tyrosinase